VCKDKKIFTASWDPFMPPDDSQEVVVKWPSNARFFESVGFDLGSYICIAGKLETTFPYCVRIKIDEYVDFDNVRRWVSHCDQNHGGYGRDRFPTPFNLAIMPRAGKRQLDFRVIDVSKMSIVFAPIKCRYLALSYVWGTRKTGRLVLTSHNEEALMKPAALTENRASIPNTIWDAITVVRKLGENYLWVDSLCLVQDDPIEIEQCVAIMDLFYEMANSDHRGC
jgi:hypothetical protein